ncbi:unnamed protein product [Blepharisma stoltei]|uniref:Mannosyltransferase n=1 Tax=Blepharisma stoltei TaxID=1481888 RepID=A0AAU9K3N6_9CILI|nr:unnamed protein product [Blepharisma stoltei]
MILHLLFRLFDSLIVRSYFSPDEYWQSLEVAHKLVFGYGELTWEWKTSELRSIIHPGIFAIFYYFLKITSLDYPIIVAYLPRIIQGFLLYICDIYVYKIAQHIFGKNAAKWTFVLQIASWFLFYGGIRTYNNSFEMALTAVGLYFLTIGKDIYWNIIVGLCCMCRPTSIMTWIPVYLFNFYRKEYKKLFQTFWIGITCFSFQILLDSLYFGKFTVTAYNFLEFNLLQGKSSFYGVHPWHWYISNGIPTVLISYLLPFLLGIYFYISHSLQTKNFPILAVSLLFSLVFLSLSPHKEFRFLLPYFPYFLIISGYGMQFIKYKFLIWIIILLQIPIAFYLSIWHQSAPLATTDTLRNENLKSVAFWINCHGTPFYSHIHQNIPMDFLHCEPFSDIKEVDEFFKNPKYYADKMLKNNYSHIVLWESLYETLKESLKEYEILEKIFHSHYTESPIAYESNVSFLILKHK